MRHDAGRFRCLMENSLDVVVEVDLEGYFQYPSPNIASVLSLTAGELLGTSLYARVYSEDLAKVRAQFALPEGQATCHYRHKDGSWRWPETTGRVLVTDSDEISMAFSWRAMSPRVSHDSDL